MLKKQILSFLSEGKSLDRLVSHRRTYAQVSVELLNLLNDNLIAYQDDRFVITDLGRRELSALSKEKMIPIEKNNSIKINLDDIYIPNYIKER